MQFTITIKRITDESSSAIQAMKAAGIYRALPDAEHTFTLEAADRKAAYRLAQIDNTLAFGGQEKQIWIDGTRELGNW